MPYIDNFYDTLQYAIKEARVHVALFLPFLTKEDLYHSTGFLWKKISLFKSIQAFNKQKFSTLELIYREESLTPCFKNLYQNRSFIKTCTDFDYIKPLVSFAESFAVIDGRGVYVKPLAHILHSGAVGDKNNETRALYFQNLFTQIANHERKLDAYQPDAAFVDIASSPAHKWEMTHLAKELNHYNLIDLQKVNPFVNRFIQQSNQEW